MSKIESLTPEQIALFPEYVSRWTSYGLSTEPADRPRAERAITLIYETVKLPPPRIVWTTSPLASELTRAILKILQLDVSVWDSVRDSVWASVRDSVRASVWDSVRDSVWASVRDSVWASVRASVRDSVWASVRDSVRASVGDSGYGQHDAGWLSFYSYFRDVVGLKQETESLVGLIELCQSAGWFLPHEKICWVSERHNILNLDERGRLHNLSGPAIAYPDGFSIYSIHGVRVSPEVVTQPIEIAQIEKENNAEVRRVMIEKYGQSKYLLDTRAELVNSDGYGDLYRKIIPGDEPLVMVKVVNSTPEPDGTYKDYFLRVPPNVKTAAEAVAWTFGMEQKQYQPEVQT